MWAPRIYEVSGATSYEYIIIFHGFFDFIKFIRGDKSKLNKKLKDKKGFTLVKLLVVIGILAIITVPALFKNINKAKAVDLKADYNAFKAASLSYYTDKNTYPEKLTENGYNDLDEYMEKVLAESPFGGKCDISVKGSQWI